MNTQQRTSLAVTSLLCCLALGACNKRMAGADDQVTGSPATAEHSSGAGQATDQEVYTGGLGRTNTGSTSLQPTALSATGKEFLTQAAQNGTLEIQAGQLAAEKAKSLQVKQFADMMVQAHSRVNDGLMQLARSSGMEVPAGPTTDGQQLLEKLRGLSGSEFDKTYSQEMLKLHKQAVHSFEAAAQTASDPQIQSFAEAQLPAMRDHLRIAQALPGSNQG